MRTEKEKNMKRSSEEYEEVEAGRKRMGGRREVLCPLIAARHNLFLSLTTSTSHLRNTLEKYTREIQLGSTLQKKTDVKYHLHNL